MVMKGRPLTERSMLFPERRAVPAQNDFQSPLRKQRYTLILATLTAGCMAFTIFFAYNSSLELPISSKLIFNRPEKSILVLNIASQITIFCLAELTICVLDAVRWAFASSVTGASAYTFLALSRATNVIGVICLLLRRDDQKIGRDGHRIWGGQR
jgi:hypothetical protein